MLRHYSLRCSWLAMLLTLSALHLSAQYHTLPAELDGTMMPYDFESMDPKLGIPDSLDVVHVCYVARHGARYISSSKKISTLTDILTRLQADGSITTTGAEFLSLLKQVDDMTEGRRWGALSDVGIMEEQRLGKEMSALFPKLMSRGKVEAKATYVPRVVMSMYEFLHALEEKNQKLDISTLSGPANDSLLRCFEVDPDYARYRDSGEWKKVYDDFVLANMPTRPAIEIFGAKAVEGKAKSLTMDIYSVLQSLQAMGMTAPTDRWMTEDEYRSCWEAANLQRYLRNTLNPLSEPYVYATTPLIRAIIEDADRNSDPKTSQGPLSCWFGHAETLMPMLSVMGIPGCSYYTDDWDSVAEHWKSQEVVPLGANFMLVLMRPKSVDNSEVYAMIRLNGRNTAAISGEPLILPWKTLRGYWISMRNEFNEE